MWNELEKNGDPKGTYNPNIQLDTKQYEVVFDDNIVKEYSTNVLSEHL